MPGTTSISRARIRATVPTSRTGVWTSVNDQLLETFFVTKYAKPGFEASHVGTLRCPGELTVEGETGE